MADNRTLTLEDLNQPVAVGQKIDKYLVTEKLGEGGIGMVFAGQHQALGRDVAIKLLRGEFAKNEQVVKRFQQEAEAVSKIGHANIVAVYDFGTLPDGSVYYVMERIKGETLTRRMQREPAMGNHEIAAVFGQICRALQATHQRGIVHRDLKPDNILLQPQDGGIPHVKVLDFGVAKMREGDGAASNMTRQGALLGTPTYMAPEQITSSATVDGRADLYSLGAMLYEVLTGQPPFGRGELMQTLTAHVKAEVVPPSKKSTRPVPPLLDKMVVKSLAKAPMARQADAATFIAELEQALGLTDKEPPKRKSAPYKAPGSSTGKGKLVGAIVGGVVLVAAGAGAFLFLGKKHGAGEQVQVKQQNPLAAQASSILSDALGGGAEGRKQAVEAMGEVGDRSALDDIISALADDNPEVRREAAQAAVLVGTPDDTKLKQALAEAGQASGGAVAIDIAAARYKVGDDTAEDELKHGLEMRDPSVRLRAAVALADAGKVPSQLLRKAIAEAPPSVKRSLKWKAYVQLHKLHDAAFEQELLAALAGADPVARLDAAVTLGRTGDHKGLVALAQIASEAADPLDRVDAASVQAELGDVGAIDALAAALTDARPKVRARAAMALGRLAPLVRDKKALEKQLSPLMAEKDAQVRIAAAAAVLAVENTSKG